MVKPGYKQTEIGVIPEAWDIKPAKDLMKIETGSRNTEHKTDYGQYPFFVRSQQVERIDSYHYDCEAVLTAGDGVGTGKVFHYIDGKFDAHQRVYVMSNFGGVLGKYFFYFFGENFGAEVSKYTAKSSVDSVRRDMIAEMLIPVPAEDEQRRIYETISDTEKLIESLEMQIAKKKAIKQGAMQELLTGKRRLPGFSGVWKTVKLEDICSKITDGSHESPPEADVGYYMPSVKDMTLIGFDYSECKKIGLSDYKKLERNGCRPDVGDVLIAKDGSILKYAFVQENTDEIVILSSIAIIKPVPLLVDSYFLAQYFRQQNFVEKVITNYKSGTGVPRIVLNGFKQITLCIPESVEEQTEIARMLVDMDREISSLEQKLAKYRQVKQGMMQQLLTGKIRLV